MIVIIGLIIGIFQVMCELRICSEILCKLVGKLLGIKDELEEICTEKL